MTGWCSPYNLQCRHMWHILWNIWILYYYSYKFRYCLVFLFKSWWKQAKTSKWFMRLPMSYYVWDFTASMFVINHLWSLVQASADHVCLLPGLGYNRQQLKTSTAGLFLVCLSNKSWVPSKWKVFMRLSHEYDCTNDLLKSHDCLVAATIFFSNFFNPETWYLLDVV